MNTTKLSRGTIVKLHTATLFYTRSEEELSRMCEDDRRSGDVLDSAGEPRIYNSQGRIIVHKDDDITVMITSLVGADWSGWYRKPKGLVKAVVTTGSLIGRQVAVHRRDLDRGDRVS